jgi:oligopeptide transport system substrate-binding protein
MRATFRASILLLGLLISEVVGAATLGFPLPDAPATLDWTGSVTTTEGPVVHLIAEGLFRYETGSGKLVPAIAESVQRSKDLKEYTFRIRKDAKWSDGVPIRAQDFVDGWLRVLSPGSSSLYNFYLFDIENGLEYSKKMLKEGERVGFRAKDDRTLVVRLVRPIRNWEATTSFWPLFPVRKDVIEKQGNNAWKAGVLPSSGPFVLVSIESNGLELKRNPHHAGNLSDLDRVRIAFDRDPKSIQEKFSRGDYAFVPNLSDDLRKRFAGSLSLRSFPILRNHVLVSNAEKFPMSSRDFRKAVFLSIDRKKILKKAGFDAVISRNLIPSPLPGSERNLVPEFDPGAARQHLTAAGVVPGKGLVLRILTRIDPANVSVATEVQEQLQRNLGLSVSIDALHEKEFSVLANLSEYDLILVGWSAKVRSPEDFLRPYSLLASNSRLRFKSPVFQQYLEEGMGAASAEEALKDFRKAQEEYLQKEMVMMPLLDERFPVLRRPGLKGLAFNHMGFPVLNDVRIQAGSTGHSRKKR